MSSKNSSVKTIGSLINAENEWLVFLASVLKLVGSRMRNKQGYAICNWMDFYKVCMFSKREHLANSWTIGHLMCVLCIFIHFWSNALLLFGLRVFAATCARPTAMENDLKSSLFLSAPVMTLERACAVCTVCRMCNAHNYTFYMYVVHVVNVLRVQ